MSQSPKTRASLILRLRQPEDVVAWEEFVEIYQPLIFRLAQSKGLQEADALDLTQDVLAKVANAVNQFNPDPNQGSFRGWISQITRNLVIDFFRKQDRQQRTADDTAIRQLIDSIPSEEPTPEDTQWFNLERERQVFAWAAEKIRSRFQPKTWEAFWMTAVEQHDVTEVAKQLGISTGAVYIARSRVMAKLKTKIRLQMESEPDSLVAPMLNPTSFDQETERPS